MQFKETHGHQRFDPNIKESDYPDEDREIDSRNLKYSEKYEEIKTNSSPATDDEREILEIEHSPQEE